jgi:hypothetical protein
MKKLSNSITYAEALEQLNEYRNKKANKNNELAERVDLAKSWVSMGMDPSQVAAILGVGAASLANVFGTMKFTMFKGSVMKNEYQETVKEIEKYTKVLITDINKYFEDTNKNIKFNPKSSFLSKSEVKVLAQEIDEAKQNKDEETKDKLEDLMAQTAALAVVSHIKEQTRLVKVTNGDNYSTLKPSIALSESAATISEISKLDDGLNLLQGALNSSALKKEFSTNVIHSFASMYANINSGLKPNIMQQYVNEKKDDEKNKKKKVLKTSL